MLKKNFGYLLLLFLLNASFNPFEKTSFQTEKMRWICVKGGSLRVNGSTNVNKFNCDIKGYSNPDTLIVYKTVAGTQLEGTVNLDIGHFDCHNSIMTSDLRKTLKAKEFPLLKIRFLSLSKFPGLKPLQEDVKGLVEIQLAGVTKRFDVAYKISMGPDKIIHLVGTRNVNFTDFSIVPPRKMGGMIKTDNQLAIEFKLDFRQYD
jgi:hypothetical protein